jgi:hypothetical protein
MILQMYSIFDSAVKAYLQPFYCRTRGEAIRSFTDAVKNPDGMFNKHALDYTLIYIGVFDDQSGVVTAEAPGPERVINATEVLPDEVPFPESAKVVSGPGRF